MQISEDFNYVISSYICIIIVYIICRCRECSQIISTLHNLKRHYARKHNEDRKITCKECGQTFNKKCQLAKHQTEHYGSVTYKCDKCTKAFTVLSRLKKHEETHNKTYPCPVPECSEIFNKWLLLRKHKKLKHKTGKEIIIKQNFFNKG